MSDGSEHTLTTGKRTIGHGESSEWDEQADWENYQSKTGVDIGTAGLVPTKAVVGDIIWKTADDWDASVSQSGVQHKAVQNTDLSDAATVVQALPIGGTQNLTDGLIGWWPLHTRSGSAPDLSGRDNNGGHNGTTRGVAGVGGLEATRFTGGSKQVKLTDYALSGDNTISCWVRAESTGALVADGGDGFFLIVDGTGEYPEGAAKFGFNDGLPNVGGGGDLRDGSWHHVVGLLRGGTEEVWVDGEQVATLDNRSWVDGGQLFIGNNYTGTIADVRLYNRALTGTEITTLYDFGAETGVTDPRLHTGTDPGAVARYPFDGSLADSWGSNTGSDNGVQFTSQGVRGQAAAVTPSNTATFGSSLLDGATAVSVTYWMRWDGTQPEQYPPRTPDKQSVFTGQPSKNGETRVIFWDANGVVHSLFGPEAPANAWYHVVATYTDSKATLYVNGIKRDQVATDGRSLNSTSSRLRIGNDATGANGYQGEIDDLRIYSRELSAHEAVQLFHWGTRGRNMRPMVVQA